MFWIFLEFRKLRYLWATHRLVKNREIHERLNLKECLYEKYFKTKSQSLHQNDNGKRLDKATQMKNRPQIEVRWHFSSAFPGQQASCPNLMPRTKSTDARLARPYTCASWTWQSIGTTRLLVGKSRNRSVTEPRRMVNQSSGMSLPSIHAKYQSDVNFENSFQNISHINTLPDRTFRISKLFDFVKGFSQTILKKYRKICHISNFFWYLGVFKSVQRSFEQLGFMASCCWDLRMFWSSKALCTWLVEFLDSFWMVHCWSWLDRSSDGPSAWLTERGSSDERICPRLFLLLIDRLYLVSVRAVFLVQLRFVVV
jgi:hypothetical protein